MKLETSNFDTTNFEYMEGSTTIRVHMLPFWKVPLAHFSLPLRALCMFLIFDTHIPTQLYLKVCLKYPWTNYALRRMAIPAKRVFWHVFGSFAWFGRFPTLLCVFHIFSPLHRPGPLLNHGREPLFSYIAHLHYLTFST